MKQKKIPSDVVGSTHLYVNGYADAVAEGRREYGLLYHEALVAERTVFVVYQSREEEAENVQIAVNRLNALNFMDEIHICQIDDVHAHSYKEAG